MNLESGKTIIARTTGKENGKEIPVEIIYISETEGRINSQDGNSMVIAGERYKKFLDKYKQNQKAEERKKQLSSVIPASASEYSQTEENDFYFDDEDEEDDFPAEEEEDFEEEPEPEVEHIPTQFAVVPKQKKAEKKKPARETDPEASKLPAKNIKIAVIILIIVAVIAAILLLLPRIFGKSGNKTPEPSQQTEETYNVAVLVNDLEQGAELTEADLEEKKISAEDYDELSRTVYVSADGESYTGTVASWNSVSTLIGRKTLRSLSKGDVLMKEDLEQTDENGAAVTEQSAMQMRIVAIISSDQLDEDMMIELGRYVFSTGQLQDILNAQNESMMPAEAATEAESK